MLDKLSKLSHYFLPGYSNNHKAKLLHPDSILIIAFILILGQFVIQFSPRVGVSILGYAANIPPEEVIKLTNEKRAQDGLPGLTYSSQLAQAAKAKGEDMIAKGYWAHVAPDGTQPWKFFSDVGYKYRYAGENLAKDFSNTASAVDAWMASPSHKENLLSSKYDEIGVAVVEGNMNGVDTTIIVQLFGRKYSEAVAQIPPGASAKTSEAGLSANLIPTQVPVVTVTPIPVAATYVSQNTGPSPIQVLVSPFKTTKGISIATISLLMVTFVVDAAAIAKKRITRVGGRTFAHLAFLGMILVIAIIAEAGQIL